VGEHGVGDLSGLLSHTYRVWGAVNFLIKRLLWGEQPTSSLSAVISFRAKSPSAKLKAEMVARFVVEPEASMQRLISLIPKTLFPRERIPSFIIRPPGLRFRPMVVYFWAPGKTQIRPFQFHKRGQLFIRTHKETQEFFAIR
jgi:hypothetical protein